jgi:radical SAM protein with 4Fe4S-binding SPASM domain
MCIRCKIACFICKKILDTVIKKTGFDKKLVEDNLQDYMFRKGLGSVLEGLAEYGAKKPFTTYSPFLVVWNYTNACNLHCYHCYQKSGTKPSSDELNTKEVLKIIDKMGDMGIAYIALSGGEPLIRNDFFKAAERIMENEIAFSIATNGTLLTKEVIKKLKRFKIRYIQVSLDGATAKTHNWLRGRNVFEKTIHGIKNSVDAGITTGIATTVTSKNYKEVPDIIDLAEKLNVSIWMHYNFIPAGRGRDIIGLDITPEQREKLLKILAMKTEKLKLNLLSTAPQYSRVTTTCAGVGASLSHFDMFSQKSDSDTRFLAEFVGGCGSGRLYFALQPNGFVTPCVFMPDIKLGDIRHDDLAEIWKNSPVLKKMRDRSKFWGGCGDCENRDVCGGCRARAFEYFGDVTGPDPGCINNLSYWKDIKEG